MNSNGLPTPPCHAPRAAVAKDRRAKLKARGCWIRVPMACTARILRLTRQLGHRTTGETVKWLLNQTKTKPSTKLANGGGGGGGASVNVIINPPTAAKFDDAANSVTPGEADIDASEHKVQDGRHGEDQDHHSVLRTQTMSMQSYYDAISGMHFCWPVFSDEDVARLKPIVFI